VAREQVRGLCGAEVHHSGAEERESLLDEADEPEDGPRDDGGVAHVSPGQQRKRTISRDRQSRQATRRARSGQGLPVMAAAMIAPMATPIEKPLRAYARRTTSPSARRAGAAVSRRRGAKSRGIIHKRGSGPVKEAG